jgi:integrase/recombinase XerD
MLDLDEAGVAAALGAWAQDHAPTSVRRAHAAWRAFLRWSAEQGLLSRQVAPPSAPAVPSAAGTAPYQVAPARDVLFGERVALAAMTRTDDRVRWPVRDRVLIGLLSRAALTLAEAIALDVGALDIGGSDASVEVSGRGGRTRTAPVDDPLQRGLQSWLAARNHVLAGDPHGQGPLLINRRGTRLTISQGRYVVLAIAASTRPPIPEGEVFTALRRAAVHRWMRHDVPPDVIARWMGLTPATTRRWMADGEGAALVPAAKVDRDALRAAREHAFERAAEQRDKAERLMARARDVLRARSGGIGHDEAAENEREPRDAEQ